MGEWRLECAACGREPDQQRGATVCGACGRPLLARYPLEHLDGAALRRAWRERPPDAWRFEEILPLLPGERPVSLREGGTPLVDASDLDGLRGLRVLVKDEGRNPTGSFKDRGLSAAVTRAVRDGARELAIPSAGNAGAALAAYAARAGVPARLFIPEDTPDGVARRCAHFGATIERIHGLIDECGRRAAAYARESGAFDVSTLREPYRIEGKKTMMLEIVDALDGRAPDAIVYPTGGGTGLIGSWKALEELRALGLVEGRTRLYAVQSDGCAPIVRAWERGDEAAVPWNDPRTEAWGLRVPGALGDFLILDALRRSAGAALSVPDEAMRDGARALGRAGIGAAIEGGATLAAARLLRERGDLREGETVILFNTAHLLVY